MSIPPDNIFDIEEEVDMDISDNELDNTLDSILDASDGVGQVWEVVDDDLEETSEAEKVKTYHLSVNKYTEWIKNLKKIGLSYNKHDHKTKIGGKRKNLWTERWFCHHYREYESIAEKNHNKKSCLIQKETKKCGCKSYISVVCPVNSSMVTLKYYYKYHNH
ncbi:677_t:CDS:1 [Cetraspora pellucida]|uniref:677_t:CDS:1 n=1 Tax=Cetraspora pellucida TaxID=1433469 RepID=A0A9N9HJI3_9GLOM|nr:677_t:CDS:1 [Cetraspora pellucida]